MSRFRNRRININDNELYEQLLEERNVTQIKHYETPNFEYPNYKQVGSLTIREHVWKKGDRYFKLAHEFYGDSKLWWVIAWYNKKPTESHVKLGDVVYIPTPVGRVLTFLRNN